MFKIYAKYKKRQLAGEKVMGDFIYCQRDIPKNKWRYGFRSSAATGCGWIATYNALLLMGKQIAPEKLIKFYERQLPLIHGNTGTFLFAPAIFFKRHGYQVKCTAIRSQFDAIVRESDACILYFWWHKKWKIGAHFVALQQTEKGIMGYNTYRNSKGVDFYGDSLQEFIKKKKYFGVVLIGLKREKFI